MLGQIGEGGGFGILDSDFDAVQMAFRKLGEAVTDVGVFEDGAEVVHVVAGAFGKGEILTCAWRWRGGCAVKQDFFHLKGGESFIWSVAVLEFG